MSTYENTDFTPPASQGGSKGIGWQGLLAQGIGDTINIGFGIFDRWQNQKNLRESWNREDSAVQRRVADLRAAGLSPTLAAGSSASTMAPTRIGGDHPNVNPLAGVMAANQISHTRKQNQLIDAEIVKQRAEASNVRADTIIKLQNASMFEDKLAELKQHVANLTQAWEKGEIDKRYVEEQIERLESELPGVVAKAYLEARDAYMYSHSNLPHSTGSVPQLLNAASAGLATAIKYDYNRIKNAVQNYQSTLNSQREAKELARKEAQAERAARRAAREEKRKQIPNYGTRR